MSDFGSQRMVSRLTGEFRRVSVDSRLPTLDSDWSRFRLATLGSMYIAAVCVRKTKKNTLAICGAEHADCRDSPGCGSSFTGRSHTPSWRDAPWCGHPDHAPATATAGGGRRFQGLGVIATSKSWLRLMPGRRRKNGSMPNGALTYHAVSSIKDELRRAGAEMEKLVLVLIPAAAGYYWYADRRDLSNSGDREPHLCRGSRRSDGGGSSSIWCCSARWWMKRIARLKGERFWRDALEACTGAGCAMRT